MMWTLLKHRGENLEGEAIKLAHTWLTGCTLYLESIVPETGNKTETAVLHFLDFLGNYEFSMLSKITVVGVFFKGNMRATLRIQKCSIKCEFVPESNDSKKLGEGGLERGCRVK